MNQLNQFRPPVGKSPNAMGESKMERMTNLFTNWGVATKQVVILCIFGLVPMAIVGYMGLSAGSEMEGTIGQGFEATAVGLADKIDRNLFERYGDVQAFGFNGMVYQREQWYEKGSENNSIARAMNQYVSTYGIYYLTILVDLKGDVVAVNDKDASGKPIDTAFLYNKNFSEAPWFKALQADKFTTKMPFTAAGNDISSGTFIEDLHIDSEVKASYPGDDGLTISFSTPVYQNGEKIGYWSNRTKFSLVEEFFTSAYKELKASGYPGAELTLLDQEGRIIVDYDPARSGTTNVTRDLEKVIMKFNLAKKGVKTAQLAVAGQTGNLLSKHARKGIWQIGGYAHLKGALGYPGMNWSVLVRVPQEEAVQAALTFERNLWVAALGCLIVIVALGLWLGRRQAKELIQVSEVAQKASQGDLTQRVNVTTKDELGAMGNALNDMLGKVSEVLGEVHQAAEQVSSASTQISAGNEDLSQRTSEQASSLEETSASMEEMTGTVKQNADNSKQANQLAITAREVAEKGGAVTMKAVDAMEEINKSSKKIADIINVIDEIAFQTNLLALNAAVEAARAGEQGRGFAVVASEVRNLAQRSATAAKEIKGLINESVQKVGDGSKLVNDSGQTLEEIVGSVKRVTDIIAEISAASQEQTTGIEQVNKAIMQMDQTTQQNAALVEQITASSQGMKGQASTLLDQVAFFKLEKESNQADSKVSSVNQTAKGNQPSSPSQKNDHSKPANPMKAQKAALPKELVGVHAGNGHEQRKREDDFFEEF